MNGSISFPEPQNADMVQFEKGSKDRTKLLTAISRLRSQDPPRLPLWIGGQPVFSEKFGTCVPPHDMNRLLAYYAQATTPDMVMRAIGSAMNAKQKWNQIPWYMRIDIFRNAAYLLQHTYFYDAVAVTMEDYSKNPYEAMIDVVELIDFWNFNAYFASEIYAEQPRSAADDFNFTDYRPWEGFIAAIPPNNFISIAMNIPTAPLIMGNVVVCKPAPETVFSFHFMLNILHEAGLPKDVLSIVHGDEEIIGEILLTSEFLSHVHFTGSMETMHKLVEQVEKNVRNYMGFPEVVGETGGKNFMVVYDDANPDEAAAAIVQSAFGYQGRKCSALSRLYLTHEMWARIEPILVGFMNEIRLGDVADFHNYLGAIISRHEYEKIVRYIEGARTRSTTTKIYGAIHQEDQRGYWVYPTIIVTRHAYAPSMTHEIFGPVLTVYPMEQNAFKEGAVHLCNSNKYKLTGAVHTADMYTLCDALDELRFAAGNLYNCRTTGAIVGRQPFGGSGKSGSNSKPGSRRNLDRWVNPGAVSLTRIKPTHFAPVYLDRD